MRHFTRVCAVLLNQNRPSEKEIHYRYLEIITCDPSIYTIDHSVHPGFCLFDLLLYVPSTIFQSNMDGSSLVEPVLS